MKETMRGLPESWRLGVGTQDLADAHRQCPVVGLGASVGFSALST